MRILIFVLFLFNVSLQAQNVLTCYDYHDFSETDCVGCGLKDSTFSGILLVKNGTIYQPLVKPIKIKTRPNILDMEDGFATRVSIYIDQITTYNTEASVLAFLRACACGVTVDSTMITEGWGINVTEPTANNYVIEADSSQVATTYDLTLKQDLLNGVAPRIPYFTSPTTLGTNPNFWWDNTYNEMVIKDRLFGSSATGQLYVGYLAGDAATSAIHSNFLSDGAGSQATNSKHSNFFGYRAGRFATNAPYSFFVGDSTGMSATNAKHSIFFGYRAGYGATNAKYSLFAGDSTGMGATGAEYANFLGYRSGYGATNAYWSNFMGYESGMSATQAYYSNFIGYKSGSGATYSYGSNFMGYLAGYLSTTSENSNFFGNSAGWMATDAANSNFFGKNAGNGAYGSYNSNFFGQDAGNGASAEHSNFLGYRSGFGQYDANYSTLIGYKVGEIFEGNLLGTNNIIIGTNINLPDSSENAMSLGNVLYGTGFKNDIYDADSTQYVSAQGKIGVLTSSPTQQLHVAGNLRVEGAVYDSNNEPGTLGQVLSTTVTGTDWVDMAGGDTTQYLNPYVMGPDTVGFYLTIAQDTVLFVATADTTAGTVDIVTGTSPIIITGDATHTPNVTIQNATTSQSGALTSTDWNTFNGKVGGSGTATRVAFWSGTSTLSSNANLYWDNTNSRLGIGTASPSKALQVTTDININGMNLGLGGGNLTSNISFGNNALVSNTTGYNNVAVGFQSMVSNTTGFENVSLGFAAMQLNTSGYGNIALGLGAMQYNTTGYYNLGQGIFSLRNNTTGTNNLALGFFSATANTTGANNAAIGAYALGTNITGSTNVAIGGSSLYGVLGSGNVGIGYQSGYSETGSNKLYIENTTSSTPLIGGDFSTDKVGINTAIGSIARTLHVTGEVRITDLTTDTPTKLVGADGDGDFGEVALSGLSMVSGTLTNSFNGDITAVTVTAPLTGGGTSGSISIGLDTTSATGVATKYDLTQVSGSSSKVIDILGSDFTTSATSLQTTDLAYTFPSTGTYEVKLYGTYTSSNTANGISFGYVESGGLTASFVTGSHYIYDRGTTASGSTMAIRGVSALGHVIATSSVVTANSPLTIMSEILVTVSATGTLTFNFASESGSYSATLQAGSSLLIEKLN